MKLSISRLIAAFFMSAPILLYIIGVNSMVLWLMPSVIILLSTGCKYYDPIFSFIFPWFLIQFFSLIPISEYSTELDQGTLFLLYIPTIIAFFVFPIKIYKPCSSHVLEPITPDCVIYDGRFNLLTIFLFLIFILNTLISGFLPFVNAIMGLNSLYKEYGVKSLNGLFNSLLNVYGLFCAYIYILSGKKKYFYCSISVVIVFVLVFSRQNIITQIIESLIIYTFVKKPIKTSKVFSLAILGLVIFSILGNLRSGSISELMKIKDEWLWLPESFFWVYGYSYFNALNLNTVVTSGYFNYFDGSSLLSLLPSIFKPEISQDQVVIPLINLNVSSYIMVLFRDCGYIYVFLFTFVVISLTVLAFNKASTRYSFKYVAVYSVLFYCASFSFFVNFWLYLPVISQIFFIILISKYILRPSYRC